MGGLRGGKKGGKGRDGKRGDILPQVSGKQKNERRNKI